MIRILNCLIMICVISTKLQAQKNINIIISIDDRVVAGSLSGIQLIAFLGSDSLRTVTANYYPGNLSLSETDYNHLLDTSVKSVFLAFNYIEHCKNNQKTYHYEIDLQKGWLTHYYYVLRIYNTDKSKYKKLFTPLEGKSYTYEYDYPGGSIKRIMKKKKNCN